MRDCCLPLLALMLTIIYVEPIDANNATVTFNRLPSPLVAKQGNLGLSPQDQRRYDELMESARQNHSRGALIAQCVCVVVGLMFIYGAYTTVKSGFKITEAKQIKGVGAKLIAIVFAAVGLGISIGGWIYVPHFAF